MIILGLKHLMEKFTKRLQSNKNSSLDEFFKKMCYLMRIKNLEKHMIYYVL